MTMKRQKTLHRFAAMAAVLLAFCLVFMMPVGATEGTDSVIDTWAELKTALSTGGDVTLGEDISYTVSTKDDFLSVTQDTKLDLAGNNIEVTYSGTESYGLIEVTGGTFTLADSVGTGKLSLNPPTNPYDPWSVAVTVIKVHNSATCIIDVKETTEISIAKGLSQTGVYAIEIYSSSGSPTLVINNGYISSSFNGVRAYLCSDTNIGKITVNGGKITAGDKRGIWIHQTDTKANPYELTITGGTIEAKDGSAIGYWAMSNSDSATLVTNIKGGTFIGDGSKYNPGVIGYENADSSDLNPASIDNHKLNIQAGTFTVYDDGEENANPASSIDYDFKNVIGFYASDDGSGNTLKGPTVTITGGTFTVSDADSLKTIINALVDDGDNKLETRPIINIDAKEDIRVTEQLEIRAPVKIVGVGAPKPTITCSVKKLFEVHANADFENIKLENTADNGRCIDTRVGGITVNIEDCVLTTTSKANNQPLTIGGSANSELYVTLSGTTINAGVAGYGIITFVPVILEIKDESDISGYGALYFKEGSGGSGVTITESKITGKNIYPEEGDNSFGVFIFESTTGVTVTLENSANVALASASGTATESIFLFKSVSGNTVNVESGIRLETVGKAVFATGTDGNTLTVKEGVISTFPIESAYLAAIDEGKLDCVATETGYIVQAVSEETVAPETPTGTETEEGTVISTTDNPGTTIKKTDGNEVTIVLPSGSDSTSEPTEDAPKISIVITGVTIDSADENTGSMESVTIPTEGGVTIVAKYENLPAAVAESESQATVALELKIADVAGTLPVIDSSINDEVVNTVQQESEPTVTTTVLAMITALGEDRNDNLIDDADDTQKIKITFTVPASLIENLQNLVAYHVSADNGLTEAQMDEPVEDGDNYKITIYGEHFSSYVLVEEEPVAEEGETVPPQTGGSATDTGAGNYQYYPRDVPADGIVSFGTSKVVTGMELPAGSSGKVTLNIKPTFAMPENGYYAFEIDSPGYNTDAKINGGLSFQIPVADLEAAGFTANDIVLFHGTVAEDGTITWEALPTNLVKNENGVAYYKAAINGCSPFYIGFVKDGSVVNTEVVDPVTPDTPETPVTPDEPEVLPPVDTPDTPEQPTESPAPILGMVLGGLAAAVVLRRK